MYCRVKLCKDKTGEHPIYVVKSVSLLKVIATESSVCAMQLSDEVGISVLHPLYLIDVA
ncbi:MAG: hypothetical protein HYY68_10110 [Thaumarchaeota archaeon]|nr:hypothetical protein [Nitrososphaerota archaeon]